MKLKFRKKLNYMLSSWHRLSIIRLLIISIFVTFLLTAYLYGLIEIKSNEVVIKIAPQQDHLPKKIHSDSSNSNFVNIYDVPDDLIPRRLVENPKFNDDSNFNKNIIININENVKMVNQPENDDKNPFVPVATALIHMDPNLNEYALIDKNISNLFLTIERFKFNIKKALKQSEIESFTELKQKYESIIKERNLKIKNEIKKEMERNEANDEPNDKNKETTDNINQQQKNKDNNEQNKDDGDTEADNENIITQLSDNEYITRDILVKFLQLERYKLKQKQKSKSIKSVKSLIDDFNTKNEVDLNDLPSVWQKYFFKINERQLFNDTQVLDDLLNTLSVLPVANCNEKEKGTQIKILAVLADGTDVLVKPMRVNRDYETPPDHYYFVDFERHHAEIAAFHLDRVLGFYRVPPTVGRVFNMTHDIWQKADQELAKTFFYSPVGNTCFTGHCSYYCDTTHAICGKPKDRMEGSVQLMLPSLPLVKWKITTHPYRRSYNKKKKAEWETNESYCIERVFQDVAYHSKIFLDLMDLSIFDFFTGNMDRHHYERMISLGNETFPLHLDNGRSFGKAFHDEMSILAPFKQCCLIRYSTYLKLKYLYKNNISKLLDESLQKDPLYPILTSSHLKAVDRRLKIVLNELNKCINKFKPTEVIVDDGY